MRRSNLSLFVTVLLIAGAVSFDFEKFLDLLGSPTTFSLELFSFGEAWPQFIMPLSDKFFELKPLPISRIKGRLLTADEGCGFSNVTNTKIVGGQDAKKGAWPWMALLGYRSSFFIFEFGCGGSLITSRHVLTAAHCITPELLFVRLGEHDTRTKSDRPHQDVKVVRKEKHNYNRFDKKNDIGILYLKRDVLFTERIRPICLPVNQPIRNQSFVNTNPYLAGWGTLKEDGSLSSVLQQLQLPVRENRVCKDAYIKNGILNLGHRFSSEVLCVYHPLSGKGSCSGDSGGPLMLPHYENGTFPFYQIGIASFGLGCGHGLGGYTNVTFYAEWILEKLKS